MTRMLGAVVVGAILIIVGMFAWNTYEQPRTTFFTLKVHVSNVTYMGNTSIDNRNYDVLSVYLNVSVPANAIAKVAFHDYYVSNPGWPTYNSSRVMTSVDAWMGSNETLDVIAIPSIGG